jgi:hypothetical protein
MSLPACYFDEHFFIELQTTQGQLLLNFGQPGENAK